MFWSLILDSQLSAVVLSAPTTTAGTPSSEVQLRDAIPLYGIEDVQEAEKFPWAICILPDWRVLLEYVRMPR